MRNFHCSLLIIATLLPAAASAQDRLGAPSQTSSEEVNTASGKKVMPIHFYDRTLDSFETDRLSHAQWAYLWGMFDEKPTETPRLAMHCDLDRSGRMPRGGCRDASVDRWDGFHSEAELPFRYFTGVALGSKRIGKWVKDKEWPLQRTIRMTVSLPLDHYRAVDWDSFEPVDLSQINIKRAPRSLKFPDRALARGIETEIDYECAIWPDHSTSCRLLGVKDEEAAPYFSQPWLERGMLTLQIGTTLKDGRPSVGKRYVGKIVMRQPG